MSRLRAAAVPVLLSVALVTGCSGGDRVSEARTGSSTGSAQSPSAPASTSAPESTPAGVVLDENGAVPRSLVVDSAGRPTVLVTGGRGDDLVTVDAGQVVRSVHLDATTDPIAVVATRDRAGDDLFLVLAARTDGSLTLFAVSGSVAEERPIDPPLFPADASLTRAAVSPDGRQVYLLTGGRGADLPELVAVDPRTGGVLDGTTVGTAVEKDIDRTALAVSDEGTVWAAVSGTTSPTDSGRSAALVQFSADLDAVEETPLPDVSVDAITVLDGTPTVLERGEGPDPFLLVDQPTSERGDRLRVSSEPLAGSGIAVSGETIAVAAEGLVRPAVTTGELGAEPRTTELCPDEGDTWAVAAAPGGGFWVAGTCGDVPQLWSVP